MYSKFLIPALAAVAAISGAAHAQDFNGPFVGAQAGWNKSDVRDPGTGVGITQIDQSRDSFVGGVFAGYDREIAPSIVLGGQADFNIGASDDITQRTALGATRLDPKWGFDLTARAGYIVAPKTLVYLRGGYANERVRTSVSNASGIRTDSANRDGWTVGGGVERIVWNKVSARLEYRYADLGSQGGKWDRHQVLIGAAYRF
ncbi:outer membrane immunogenic protein [Sphingobium sp. AP50]|uniref:outer membrane protein n=1 Tax=Sphingobium sp. AP50 TaxID=1884369 RepID=UPI0008B2D28C|nr:outer membrane beta-barrel protein [Sphingobium sp. AP50]SEJ81289.1 outer membrane immunogenic protein [Sphingobium sp. AP50]